MDEQAIGQKVREAVPDAEVHANDLTGGGDHWHCVVISPSFAGMRSFQRQRAVLKVFTPLIADGTVHAMDLKCMTPEEVAANGVPKPFVPHERGEGMHPGQW